MARPAQLWCCSVAGQLRSSPEHHEQWLSASESGRLASIKAPHRRDQFLAGRWLARRALAARHGGAARDWRLSAPPDGPPRAAHGRVACNDTIGLSHSGDTVACVLDDGAIGIDVERHDRRARNVPGLAELALNDSERARWLTLPETSRDSGFLSWWTLKEAWLKAHGRALDPATLRGIEALPSDAATANARLWSGAGFTLAVVGLDATSPLELATCAPSGAVQWWSVGAGTPSRAAA